MAPISVLTSLWAPHPFSFGYVEICGDAGRSLYIRKRDLPKKEKDGRGEGGKPWREMKWGVALSSCQEEFYLRLSFAGLGLVQR